jgi:hypothetical protein
LTAIILGSAIYAQSAYADLYAGRIALIDVNEDNGLAGRATCVQLSPALPTDPWACLLTSNALYREITAVVYAAYFKNATTGTGPSCVLTVNFVGGPAHWEIRAVQCGQ